MPPRSDVRELIPNPSIQKAIKSHAHKRQARYSAISSQAGKSHHVRRQVRAHSGLEPGGRFCPRPGSSSGRIGTYLHAAIRANRHRAGGNRPALRRRCRDGNSIHEPLRCIEKTIDHPHSQFGLGSQPDGRVLAPETIPPRSDLFTKMSGTRKVCPSTRRNEVAR